MKSIGVLLLLLAPAIAADPDAAIRDAENGWSTAVTGRNFEALERILGHKLIYAHATGAIESKDQYLARLRSGTQRYDSITRESIRIVPYGDSAITHSILTMRGTTNGKPFNDHVMALHVWEKQDGTWTLVAHQTTKLP